MFVENQRYIRKPKGIFKNIEYTCKVCGKIGIANSIQKTTCFDCRRDRLKITNELWRDEKKAQRKK